MVDSRHFGVIGMAVMGRSLALNLLDHGTSVAAYNLEPEMTDAAVDESGGRLLATRSLEELSRSLARPRKILMMIKSGRPVDIVSENLAAMLEPGDIVIDGGNSYFEDTIRRERSYAERGLCFVGSGVSGGAMGARFGPSLMPGGSREAYDAIRPTLEAIAAKTKHGPCVTYCGPNGAGHFVKMVHNGIEYADMQAIAESYHVLRDLGGLAPPRLADVFTEWNEGPLESYLIEITSKILRVPEPHGNGYLVDHVLDQAGQKGTGRWTAQTALEHGVPIPSIIAAIDARVLSSRKAQRERASTLLSGPPALSSAIATDELITSVRDALTASRIVSYAQGMDLIGALSDVHEWSIDLREIARIWTGGCIIRARLLETIIDAYRVAPDLDNLLLDPELGSRAQSCQEGLRRTLSLSGQAGIPTPVLGASLAYFDSLRSATLPQNLTQAQRDAFGAHSYRLVSDPSTPRHTDWLRGSDGE